MSDEVVIIGNVEEKLSDLPNEFVGIPVNIGSCINDTLRELEIESLATVKANSQLELYIELRATYWAMVRIRNKVATNFKYSTGNEGKSVDKTDVFKAIDKIISNLDSKFSTWYKKRYPSIPKSTLWNMERRSSYDLGGVE